MESFNTVPDVGSFGQVVSVVNANFQLAYEELQKIGKKAEQSRGLFPSVAALTTAYPTPKAGEWAYVGNSFPVAIYECVTAGVWENSGATWNGESVDLTNYALKADTQDLSAKIGYFTAYNQTGNAAISITATGFRLTAGGCMRIKMVNAVSTSTVTLNINSTGAKTLYYNGLPASIENSWSAGEVIEVYYDGTQYQSARAQVKVILDDEPTAGSEKLVKSRGIFDAIPFTEISPYGRVSVNKNGTEIVVTFNGNINILSDGGKSISFNVSEQTYTIPNYYTLAYDFSDSSLKVLAAITKTTRYVNLLQNENGNIVGGLLCKPYLANAVLNLDERINNINDIPNAVLSPFERVSVSSSGNVITVTWGINNKVPTLYFDDGSKLTPNVELGTTFVIEDYYCLVYDIETNSVFVGALPTVTTKYITIIQNEHGKIVGGLFAAYYNNIEFNAQYNAIDSKVNTLETDINDIYTENSGDISILPTKPEQLTDSVTWQNYFSPLPLFDMFYKNGISSIDVEYFIYKPASGITTMNLAIVSVPVDADTVPTVLITENIALQSSWLDNTYGNGVYKVPYKKRVNGIPAVRNIYFKQNISGIGFIDCTRSYNAQSPTSMSGEIFFGIIGKGGIGGKLVDSPWKNKSVCFLGDSITAHGHYIRAFQQITGAKVINEGISGTCMVMSDVNTVNSFEQRVSGLADSYDALIIAGGVNDFRVDTCEWGNLSDGHRTGVYTFYAGLHRLFNSCANKYFGKPVVIMTPMHNLDNQSWGSVNLPEFIENQDGSLTFRTNPVSGKTLAEYVNAIKEVAAFYSLPVIDCYSASGMCPYLSSQRGTYYPTTDFLHPNSNGGVKIGRFITAHMDVIYKEFYQQYD